MAKDYIAKRDGRYLERKDPVKFGQVLAMLGNGEPYGVIAKELGVKWNAIQRIDAEHAGEIGKWKERAAGEAERAAKLTMERIYADLDDDEKMDRERLKDKAIAYAIFKDKEILLKGEATSRSETVAGASVEAAKAAIEEARKRISAEVIDV